MQIPGLMNLEIIPLAELKKCISSCKRPSSCVAAGEHNDISPKGTETLTFGCLLSETPNRPADNIGSPGVRLFFQQTFPLIFTTFYIILKNKNYFI